MPRHIFRLILLIAACGALGYGVKRFFTVTSFYEYGHYRGDSVAEIASEKPKYKGVGYCASCHLEQLAEWSKGVHNSTDVGKVVRCEVCHGAAGERDAGAAMQVSTTGPDHPSQLKLVVPVDTRKLCTTCHERLTGRPLQQRQIAVAEHAGTQQCTVCHNPHSPRLNLVSAEAAAPAGDADAGKAGAAVCTGCHGDGGPATDVLGPKLAGQNAAYLVEALKAYRTGARDNATMGAIAQATSEQDAGNLAAYFSGLKCTSAAAAGRDGAPGGQSIASRCTACHGADGRANNRLWPNLAGQSTNYLIDALKAYRSGARKNPMMAAIAKELAEADVENVATYYSAIACR